MTSGADGRSRRGWIGALALAGFALLAGIYSGTYGTFPAPQLFGVYDAFAGALRPANDSMYVDDDAVEDAKLDVWLNGKADVVMFGDSITAGGRWEEMFAGIAIHDRGIGGDTITGMERRVPQVIAKKPGKVFMLAGINDVFAGNKEADILARYAAVAKALAPQTELYLQSIILCGEPRCDDDRRAVIKRLNAKIAEIAKANGATYLDLNAALAPDGQIAAAYTTDGVHLSGDGYRVLRDLLAPHMRAAAPAKGV